MQSKQKKENNKEQKSNAIRNRKATEKISETRIWFFVKSNEINKHLARMTKEK